MTNNGLLAAIILTYNEEIHIKRCIQSLGDICSEVFVIDSHSTDRTVSIAAECGAKVLRNRFLNQSQQMNWALQNIETNAAWLIRIDADEIIEGDLRQEIEHRLPSLASDVVGVELNRKHIFLGRWIRHGGRYPLYLLRIWRRGRGAIEDVLMDEHVTVSQGKVERFSGGFCDWNLGDLTYFTAKHNQYATREAIAAILRRHGSSGDRQGQYQLTKHAARRRFLKVCLYEKMPFPLGPIGYFLHRYFVQFGILDGIEGAIYHFLQGFWYRFLVEAKIIEFSRLISKDSGSEAIRERLEGITRTSVK